MAGRQVTPLLACEHCGQEADGIDEHGDPLCAKCAATDRGWTRGERHGLSTMLEAVVTCACEEGMADDEIRKIVEDVLAPSPPFDGLEGGES